MSKERKKILICDRENIFYRLLGRDIRRRNDVTKLIDFCDVGKYFCFYDVIFYVIHNEADYNDFLKLFNSDYEITVCVFNNNLFRRIEFTQILHQKISFNVFNASRSKREILSDLRVFI